jgi:hypothetical protein
MRAEAFPDPMTYRYPEWVAIGNYYYQAHDVVAFGTPLTPENVREAYLKGIFPWNTEGLPLPWHCPERRAILVFDELTVPRSLEKVRRKTELTFTIDRDFRSVMHECALAYRPGQGGTWISPEFEIVYNQLPRRRPLRHRRRRRILRRIDVLQSTQRLKTRPAFSYRSSERTRLNLARLPGDDTAYGAAWSKGDR